MGNFDAQKEADAFRTISQFDGPNAPKETAASILHHEYCSLTQAERAQTLQELGKLFPAWSEQRNGVDVPIAWHNGTFLVDTNCFEK